MKRPKKVLPVVLAILDGWGIAPKKSQSDDATSIARTPFLDEVLHNYPTASLQASGKWVGLPVGQDGNSEAGHLNIGAGRVVDQDAVRISKAIHNKSFFKNSALQNAIAHVKKNNSSMHLMGLMSSYNSGHSSPEHFMALLKFVQSAKLKRVYLHLFTDGRDSPKYDAVKFIGEVKKRLNGEVVATVTGRFYAMDRKKEWSRTAATYDLLTQGKGIAAPSVEVAIRHAYNRGESDEFISPTVIVDAHGKPKGLIGNQDAVIFFNLRSDRARQLAKPFVQERFEKLNLHSFKRKIVLKQLCFVALTDFGPDLGNILTAFPSSDIQQSLPMALSAYKQLYVAESEKFAHMTYFFNGGYDHSVAGEDRVSVPSPNVPSYDATPAMSAPAITRRVVREIKRKHYSFIALNLANPDMVGHTGNLRAGVLAMEVVDKCLKDIGQSVRRAGGTLFLVGDHGNAEEFINRETGEVDTEHSTNPVPFVLYHRQFLHKKFIRINGVLGDVAPTILDLIGVPKPIEMTRKSLFRR